jgi:hypothetical protein
MFAPEGGALLGNLASAALSLLAISNLCVPPKTFALWGSGLVSPDESLRNPSRHEQNPVRFPFQLQSRLYGYAVCRNCCSRASGMNFESGDESANSLFVIYRH